MEPDVIRMYSSSPPPMEDGAEEEEDEFGDFGTFSAVPNSISFTEFDTPTTFNQTQALAATSPPELINSRGAKVFGSSNATTERPKANGVPASQPGGCLSERTETRKVLSCSPDVSGSDTAGGELADCNGEGTAVLTNGFGVQGSPSSQSSVLSHIRGTSTEDTGTILVSSPADDFADFAAFSDAEELSQTTNKDSSDPSGVSWVGDMSCHDQHCDAEQGTRPEDQHCNTEQGTRPEDQHCNAEQGTRPEDQHCNAEQGTRPEDQHCNTEQGTPSEDQHCNTEQGTGSEDQHCNTEQGTRPEDQHCNTEQGTRPEDQHCNTEQGTRPEDQHCNTEQGTRPEDQHCNTEQGTRPEDQHCNAEPGTPSEDQHCNTEQGTRPEDQHCNTEQGTRPEDQHCNTEQGTRPEDQHCNTEQGTPSEDQHCNTEQGTRPEDQHSNAEQGTRPEDQHCNTEQGTRPEDQHCNTEQGTPSEDQHCNAEQGTPSEDALRDTNRTEPNVSGPESRPAPAEALDRSSHTDADQESSASDAVCTDEAVSLNTVDVVVDGDESKDAVGCNGNDLSPETSAVSEEGQSDEKDSWNETETETETSFGRPLSTDALEEYADISTTGSVPSPPLQGEPSTPADHSQLAEDDEDFGDFGDADSFGGQGFADFEELDVEQEQSTPPSSAPAQEVTNTSEDNDFGDFNSPNVLGSGNERQDEGEFEDFPVSDSFGNFSSAAENAHGEEDAGWSAFGEQEQPAEEESWAAFSSEQSVAREEEEDIEEEWHEGDAGGEETSSTGSQAASLSTRLLTLFQSSFPHSTGAALVEDEVASLRILLEPPEDKQPGDEETRSTCNRWVHGGVWTQLQDINEALGLRYQWGGSHGNKVLLCCLGIDTRNILFTGQKKQPVIVPMYAASLGMLEPTKEPVKPVSAAEMITSIAQASPLAPEKSSCPSDSVQQDALPPVQFDWSSSGLTNPLDASGGSSLLNLDFFGPVEDSGSNSSTSIPGVDPELYELTTAKLDAGSSGSRMADAFARLMSTMEKTSTSTRKPRRDENLSEEAAKVISALPDLSFMTAKVLMFPATLTPLDSQAA